MSHDRNPGPDRHIDKFRDPASTLEFHSTGPRLLHHASGVPESLLVIRLIRHERHVDNDHSSLYAPHDRQSVVDHLVERHGNRRFVSLKHHAERIPHEQKVDPGLVEQTRRQKIIRRQACDRLAVLLEVGDRPRSDALGSAGGRLDLHVVASANTLSDVVTASN